MIGKQISKIHIRNVSRFLASIVLEICWRPSDSLGAFWDLNSKRYGLLFLLLMIRSFACPNWALFFVLSPCRVVVDQRVSVVSVVDQLVSVGRAVASDPLCCDGRFHSQTPLHTIFPRGVLLLSPFPTLSLQVKMVSLLQHLPPPRGRGLGCPCCSAWLDELVLPESPS